MSTYLSSYPSLFGSRGPIGEIYDIIRQHNNTLYDLRFKAKQAIEDWCSDLIKQIREHAAKQSQVIENAFDTHQKHLDKLRDQYLQMVQIYQKDQKLNEIDQLLKKFKSIQLELVNMKFPPTARQFIEVTLVEPSEYSEIEDVISDRISNDRFESQSKNTNETTSVRDSNFNSYLKPAASTTDPTNRVSKIETSYNSESMRNITTDNRSITSSTTNDDLDNKCPICFMIFPSYMSEITRSMHVNEH